MRSEKILVLGSSGMVGHAVGLFLERKGYDVTGFSRRNTTLKKAIRGDIHDIDRLGIDWGCYDYIINCLGILNQNAETEKANAAYINSYIPHYIADNIVDLDCRLIHISTDCVFRGDKGCYMKDDFRDAVSFYGRSKALGEIEDDSNITIRTSVIGPDINADGIGLFNWFMKQKSSVTGYKNVMWTGVTTIQLAKVIQNLFDDWHTGIYNVVPKSSISKYDLLEMFNRIIRSDALKLVEDYDHISDKSLSLVGEKGFFSIPTYEEMVWEMKEWIDSNKELYAHYF